MMNDKVKEKGKHALGKTTKIDGNSARKNPLKMDAFPE